jgi:hypothetical protein
MSDRDAHERLEAVYAFVREPLARYLARRCSVDAVDDLSDPVEEPSPTR